jgi:hypothetical protein
MHWKHVSHMDNCVDGWNTNLWMNECHMNFTSSYKFMCQFFFQCMILMHETYALWINNFHTIFITKSWDVKFLMGTSRSQSLPPTPNIYTSKKHSSYNFFKKFKNLKPKPTYTSRGSTILYTKSLIAITPREAVCRTIKGQATKAQMLNECQVSQLIHAQEVKKKWKK